VARALIVGCGGRGQALASELVALGLAVRGTTRSAENFAAIAETGAEPVLADPDRVGTLFAQFPAVTVACWLMGTANGTASEIAALYGPRLSAFLEKVVDSPVRGVVVETAGTVDPELLEAGGQALLETADVFSIPCVVLDTDPADRAAWLAAATTAVTDLAAGRVHPGRPGSPRSLR
jgi:hypothetical protein